MKYLYAVIILAIFFSCSIEEPNIPNDVNYSVIDEDENGNLSKTNLNVRLNKRVSKDVLEHIGNELKSDRKEFSKVWIFYLLPNMKVGKGAWATTHFTPNLEINILGGTIEDELKFKEKRVSGNILAKWIDNEPASEGVKYLVEENGKLFMKKLAYKDGWDLVEELGKSKSNGKTKYTYKNIHGEYYLIEDNGNLGIYSDEGRFKELAIIE